MDVRRQNVNHSLSSSDYEQQQSAQRQLFVLYLNYFLRLSLLKVNIMLCL
jgi:hypothetical protein